MNAEYVSPDEVKADESTPGLSRQVIFETENNVLVKSSIESGTTTGWHHHCDRHAYGYLLQGSGSAEFGPGGSERWEGSAPLFFHIPPGEVHREIAATDMEVVVSFVGSGPLFENVDSPEG